MKDKKEITPHRQRHIKELKSKYEKKTSKNIDDIKIPEQSKKLTHKQILFSEEYIKTLNATQSYLKIHPNVKDTSARVLGDRMLHNINVRNYIEERLRPYQEEKEKEVKKAIADADEILEFITAVIRGEVKDQLGFETSVKDRLTASKMLADRYKLFESPKESSNENDNAEEHKVIFEVVDNSHLEKTLFENNK